MTMHKDVDSAMVLVDILRQRRRFTEAMETLDSLMGYLRTERTLIKIGKYERLLICNKDSRPHLMKEVF